MAACCIERERVFNFVIERLSVFKAGMTTGTELNEFLFGGGRFGKCVLIRRFTHATSHGDCHTLWSSWLRGGGRVRGVDIGRGLKCLLLVWWLGVSSVVAGAGGWELEAVDGEWEVLIIWIVDQEPVVDVLLDALCLVAFGHQWASRSGGGTLLDASGLGQGLVVGLDVVDDNPPLAVDVDGAQGLDVGSLGGAQVSLLHDVLQASHGVVGVGQNVLVHLLDSVVVVLDGLLDLVGGVLLVLKAPGLGVVLGALGWTVMGLLVGVVGGSVVWSMVWGSMVHNGVVWGGVVRSWVVWLWVVWGWLRVIWGWLRVVWSRLRVVWSRLRMVWGWLRMVWSWGGGVAVGWRGRRVAIGSGGVCVGICVSSRHQG